VLRRVSEDWFLETGSKIRAENIIGILKPLEDMFGREPGPGGSKQKVRNFQVLRYIYIFHFVFPKPETVQAMPTTEGRTLYMKKNGDGLCHTLTHFQKCSLIIKH